MSIDPNHFDSINLLSNIFAINRNFEKAKDLLIKANKIQPNNKSVLNNLGTAYKELGDNEELDELAEIEKKINELKLTNEAKDKCKAELKKLKNMSPMSAEATVIRNYLDWVLSIPWNNPTSISKNINKARSILEADHYG